MKLEIGNNQGHVIIDDTSGKIMSVVVVRAVEGNSDFIATTSFTNNHDGTHTDSRLKMRGTLQGLSFSINGSTN